MKTFLVALLIVGLVAADNYVLTQSLIDDVNSKNPGWTAGYNDRFNGMTEEQFKTFLGTKLDRKLDLPMRAYAMVDESSVPDEFDARQQWPGCIGAIRDQGQCGSCWAFGASEALADRYCIQAGVNVVLSPQDMVSCDSGNYGCQGGYLDVAWKYLENSGIVADECFPYVSGQSGSEPPCPSSCTGSGEWVKYKAKNTVQVPQSEAQIQQEVMTNGPVEVAFEVYSDFMSYSGGVYKHTSGSFMGGHAVKLIGWGVDAGTKYWLIANSWGTSWGESGLFRIVRGTNECGIEAQAIAGMAAPSKVDDGSMITEEFVAAVNEEATTWTAAVNERFQGWTEEDFKQFLGLKMDRANRLPVKAVEMTNDLPSEFDSRQQWPNCIGDIRDQGQCGSCWAFGAAEALSDRFCIGSKGSVNVILSTQDMVSCDTSNYGCQGGYLDLAWQYLTNTGTVVESCFPYVSGQTGSEPPCPQGTCPGTGEPTKYKATGAASVPANEQAIMQEIYNNGPVETGFNVYSDFMSYSGGVYKHTSGSLLGGHAVKIVGWGEESGTKYWLVANSWGTSWGESGFFRILKGTNECGFEGEVIAGLADLSSASPIFA